MAEYAPSAEALIREVEAGLKSCAGCTYEPLQECYEHGENAARFYIDYAVKAMYHFAGVAEPVSGNTMSEADITIPAGLCGAKGCVYLAGHNEETGGVRHSWQ